MLTKGGLFPVLRQIIRYGIVGILNNLLGYLIYLAVTWLGLDPKVAVTILYPIGAFTSYFGHARYSFTLKNNSSHVVVRYVIAHCVGYGATLLMLYIFTDKLFFPHQIVQAAAIFVVAAILYLMFRYFVFPDQKSRA